MSLIVGSFESIAFGTLVLSPNIVGVEFLTVVSGLCFGLLAAKNLWLRSMQRVVARLRLIGIRFPYIV